MLSRLKDILDEMEAQTASSAASITDFEDPNWAYKQAFRNGDQSRVKAIKQLLEFIS